MILHSEQSGTDLQALLDEVTHIALFTNSGNVTDSASTSYDKNIIAWITPDSVERSGNLAIITYTIASATGICPSDTVASNTSTTITLNDATGFAEGDLIKIDSASLNNKFFGVTGISTNTLTLDRALEANPAVSTNVYVYHNQFGIIRNGTTSGTGTLWISGNERLYKTGATADITRIIRFRMRGT